MLHTKWGTARIYNGHYQITSGKEGNHGKLLHRLIWEDFYNCEVPKGYVIHHRDHNPLNNCILNLQLMRKNDHNSLHKTSKTLSKEHKKKISKARNISGYLNVSKQNSKTCTQGFRWVYTYYENGKPKQISSVDIKKLEAKVKAKDLTWEELE